MRVLSQSLVWWWVSGRMTFLDLTEGDKLAVVVVELHVGRGDSVMRSGIKIRYLLCSAKFEGTPVGARLSRNATHSHAHVLCLCLSLGCIAVSAGLG